MPPLCCSPQECLKFQSRTERLLADLHTLMMPLTVSHGSQLYVAPNPWSPRACSCAALCVSKADRPQLRRLGAHEYRPCGSAAAASKRATRGRAPARRPPSPQLGSAPLLVREYMRLFSNACRLVLLLKGVPRKDVVQVGRRYGLGALVRAVTCLQPPVRSWSVVHMLPPRSWRRVQAWGRARAPRAAPR